MPTIILETEINADIQLCFDFARSIDLHQISTKKTKEKAIDGIINGLIKLNEIVTWQATHFGIRQKLTSKITAFESPFHFRDEQQKGVFKSIYHDHYFERKNNQTIMKDVFKFESPFGIFGRIFNQLILINYLRKFLKERNQLIKKYAESEEWKTILKDDSFI